MKLTDVIPKEHIRIPLESTTKEDVITELVDIVAESDPAVDRNTVLKAIFEREETMSTGIGHGVAIPHGKSKGCKTIVGAFGVAPNGINFDALDGKPVYLFFLISAPEGPAGPHLRCLSRLSRLLNREQFREDLLNAQAPGEAYRIIEEGEQHFFEME